MKDECKDIHGKIPEYLEGNLSQEDEKEVSSHSEICVACESKMLEAVDDLGSPSFFKSIRNHLKRAVVHKTGIVNYRCDALAFHNHTSLALVGG